MDWGSEYQRLVKAKYTKRTGSPGNYKYEYANSGATHGKEDRALDGMEGPFTFPGGRELYYDNSHEGGTYYDRGQDRYLSMDEAERATSTTPGADQEKREKAQYHAEMQAQAANKEKRDKAQLEKLKSSTDTGPAAGIKFDSDGGLTEGTMSKFEGKFNGFTAADHEASSNAHFKEMRGASDRGDFKKLEGHSQMMALHDEAANRKASKKPEGTSYNKPLAPGDKGYNDAHPDNPEGLSQSDLDYIYASVQADASDFGKPLPNKPKKEGESEFEHKISQWTDEVKERPGRFPGGQKQAIAIAAEQAGVSKGNTMSNIFNGWMTKGFPEDMGDVSEEEVDEIQEEAESDEAEKGALGAGYSSGMSQGAGYASSPGGGGAAAVQSAPGAISTVAGSGASKPAASASPAASAPSAAPKNSTGSASGSTTGGAPAGGGVGKSQMPQEKDDYMNHGSGSCSACQSGNCPHGVKKAITSRSMAIPFYLRAGINDYDPDGIRRSATAQNSAQYTSLAPQVRESMEVQENISAMRASNEATSKCFAHGVTYKSQNCPLCTTAKSLGTVRQDMRFGNR